MHRVLLIEPDHVISQSVGMRLPVDMGSPSA